MIIVEGVVTACGIQKWENPETKQKGETMRFAIEGWNLILDNNVPPESLPDVGQTVRALVNRVWSAEKKREYFFVLGFQPFPVLTAVNGHASQRQELAY